MSTLQLASLYINPTSLRVLSRRKKLVCVYNVLYRECYVYFRLKQLTAVNIVDGGAQALHLHHAKPVTSPLIVVSHRHATSRINTALVTSVVLP